MSGIAKLLAKERDAESVAAKATQIAKKLTAAGKPCTRQVIEHWVKAGRVPGTWAPLVNKLYRIPLHELLNSDIYPKSAA